MYTPFYFKLVHISCEISSYFGTLGIKFNLKKSLFYSTPQIKSRHLRACRLITFYFLFFVWKTVEIYFRPEKYLKDSSLIGYYVSIFLFTLVIFPHWIAYLHLEDLVLVLNRTIQYVQRFGDLWMPTSPGQNLIFMKFMELGLASCLIIVSGALMANAFFFVRYSEIYPHSIFSPLFFESDSKILWLIYALITIADGIIFFMNTAACWFLSVTFLHCALSFGIPIFYIIAPKLKYRPQSNVPKEGKSELRRNPSKVFLEYNCMQLILKEFLQIAGYILFHVHSLIGQFCLFCNFTIIKGWAELGTYILGMLVIWGFGFQIFWAIFLELCGRIRGKIEAIPKSWRTLKCQTKSERRHISMICRSCRPIGIGIDGVFTFKRLSVLKFFRAIVKATFRALLTVGKKK